MKKQKTEFDLKSMLMNFFFTGMEACNCDECGAKGTGEKFDGHLKAWEKEIEVMIQKLES